MKKHISFASRIYSQKTIHKIETKMILSGLRNVNNAETFLNFRLGASLLFGIISFCFLYKWPYLPFILMLLCYYLLPIVCLDRKIKKRTQELEKDAMLFFETLSLAVESGKDILTALQVTTDTIDSSLSKEFKILLHETQYGKGFVESLESMRKRIPSNTINNVLLNMIECYTNGGNLSQSLMEQVAYIRTNQVMSVKEKINRLPIQISVVSVVLMVPMILLLVLAPAIIEYLLG